MNPASPSGFAGRGPFAEQYDLLRRLVAIGEAMVADRRCQLADETVRTLRDQVKAESQRLLDNEAGRLIGVEALCTVELLAALAYARAEENVRAELRMTGYLNPLLSFMHLDLDAAAPHAEVRR
jgi:hypothetical protein